MDAILTAADDPQVAAALDRWFDGTVHAMRTGTDRAARFDAETRQSRAMVAFGQFECVSRQWFRRGWQVEREALLETLTDSWCHLLTR